VSRKRGLPRLSWRQKMRRTWNRYTVGSGIAGGFLALLVVAVFILRVDIQTHDFGILPQGNISNASQHVGRTSFTAEQQEVIRNHRGGIYGVDTLHREAYADEPIVKEER